MMTSTDWNDIKLTVKYFLLTVWELIKILFIFAIVGAIIFGIFSVGKLIIKDIIKDIEEDSKERRQRQIEINESFKKSYAGKEFYKFNLDGHDYWYIDSGSRGGGLCHSETCQCKTNAVETAR